MLSKFFLIFTLLTLAWATDLIPRTSVNGDPQVVGEIRRLLALHAQDQKEYSTSASLDLRLTNATLFKFRAINHVISNPLPSINETTVLEGGMHIVCRECYTKGNATARLTIDSSNNVTDGLEAIEQKVKNTVDGLIDWFKEINVDWFDRRDLAIPAPPNQAFEIADLEFPECKLQLSLSGMEVYLDMQTIFSMGMWYKLRLYQSFGAGVELGFEKIDFGPQMFFGLVFAVDLIITVDGELKIDHGFHLKLDDIVLNLNMFADDIADLQFNGGEFEFLPIEIDMGTSGIGLKAALQVSVRAGFSIVADLLPGPQLEIGPLDTNDFMGSVGLETRLHVNLAEIDARLDLFPNEECDLRMNSTFQFAVGAEAGAYVGIGDQTWGPTPSTEWAILPQTINTCLNKADAPATTATSRRTISTTGSHSIPTAATEAALIGARFVHARHPEAAPTAPPPPPGMVTKTISKEVTYKAAGCAVSGVLKCPKETFKVHVVTETLITVVPTNVKPTWPETMSIGPVAATKEFGKDKGTMAPTSGKPGPTAPVTSAAVAPEATVAQY